MKVKHNYSVHKNGWEYKKDRSQNKDLIKTHTVFDKFFNKWITELLTKY
jgi:hypothetical protein